MAKIVQLYLRQGETFRWSPTIVRPAEEPDGEPTPLDFEGCTARAQFRQRYGSDVLVEINTENGGITVGPEPGRLHILITAEQADALGATPAPLKPRTAAVWDLEVIYPSGDVRRPMQGPVAIDPNITREVAG